MPDQGFFNILFPIIIGGIIGGIASYYASDITTDEQYPRLRRIILGITAAFVVPLFLKITDSNLLTDPLDNVGYLTLLGFCIIAGFSSKAFLTTMSQQLLNKVESMERRQSELEEEIDPILVKETEPQVDAAAISNLTISSDEQKVLQALGNPNYTRRYIGGIYKETGLNSDVIQELLQSLQNKGLARQRKGENGDLFWLTAEGRACLAKL